MNAPAPTELLPCPFCGGPATLGGLPNGIIGYVRCRNDNCFGPKTTAVTKRDSIIQWNTRQAASVGAEQTEDYNSEAILAAGKRILARNQTKPVERAEVAGEAVGYVSPLTLKALLDDPAGAGPIVACAGYDTTIPLYASPSRSEGVSKGEVLTEDAFKYWSEEWRRQIISAGGDENVAQQAVTLAALNGLFDPIKALGAAQAAPDGWKLVPIEPTKDMIQASIWALDRWREKYGNVQGHVPPGEKYQIRWRAMLEASPVPSAQCEIGPGHRVRTCVSVPIPWLAQYRERVVTEWRGIILGVYRLKAPSLTSTHLGAPHER